MTPPFEKILIANRGEIAVRIIRACREMGIRSVAVFSEPDASALHVRLADEACAIGPAPAAESYLRGERIVEVARDVGAGAIHPGYGFLAENPEFARLVTEAGMTWIGPPAEVIALMGDKLAAKRLAGNAGVPVVPGYEGETVSPARLAAEATRIGFPIMIKAAAGGGGKGMRVVSSPDELQAAAEAAGREALAAFGDGRVFLERALVNPRHIEIQIFADSQGRAIYLGERECSIQRRHQKVLEESLSPVLTPELRVAMGEAALRVARAAGYVNAGTVEFLFAGDAFYFLEVNTRIQVEHPVTEMVTGLDLVRMQIEVAAGRPLLLSQQDVALRGHAIEARLYAEDPSSGFLPATGRLGVFLPPSGPGVRNDVGVEAGSDISPHYDPILAKLIVHAETRREAVSRLESALDEYGVLGVTTNQGFLRWVVATPAFRDGQFDTGFVEREWRPQEGRLPTEVLLLAVALEVGGSATTRQERSNPWKVSGGWRIGGSAREYRYRWQGETVVVEAQRDPGGTWTIRRDEEVVRDVVIPAPGQGRISVIAGARVTSGFALEANAQLDISWQGSVYRLDRASIAGAAGGRVMGGGRESLLAPMPGTVIRVLAKPGTAVSAHEPLVVMEAMKMEHVIEAPYAGVVREVLYGEGDMVPAGSPLVRLEGHA